LESGCIVRKKGYDMGVAVPPEELDGLSRLSPAVLFLGVSTAGQRGASVLPAMG
jgi:hypothetical protein